MACRAVHFAITDEDLAALQETRCDDEVMQVVERIEERWEKDDGFVHETDKAWDAIHRCLTDGELSFENGSDPLRLCILGGMQLFDADEHIVALLTNDQLRPLADALKEITPEFMGARYSELPESYDNPKTQEDLDYTWGWFLGLPEFFDRAEKAGRHVIFTVDQ